MKGKEFLFRERVCPVCKARFIPTGEWVYKKYYGNSERIFCSWKCLRKTEVERGTKIDRRERIIQAIRDGLTNSEIALLLEEKGTTISYWRKKVEEEEGR